MSPEGSDAGSAGAPVAQSSTDVGGGSGGGTGSVAPSTPSQAADGLAELLAANDAGQTQTTEATASDPGDETDGTAETTTADPKAVEISGEDVDRWLNEAFLEQSLGPRDQVAADETPKPEPKPEPKAVALPGLDLAAFEAKAAELLEVTPEAGPLVDAVKALAAQLAPLADFKAKVEQQQRQTEFYRKADPVMRLIAAVPNVNKERFGDWSQGPEKMTRAQWQEAAKLEHAASLIYTQARRDGRDITEAQATAAAHARLERKPATPAKADPAKAKANAAQRSPAGTPVKSRTTTTDIKAPAQRVAAERGLAALLAAS